MSDSMYPTHGQPGNGVTQGLIVGTAGHIDHGKTSLVRALTGIDTDRLAEEKQRGISIDLGFAHLMLKNGIEISFIDVPGHERFVRNMLAGAAGMRAVMLIVAATESVMPQTREHFQICRLLNVRHGFVVLTKVDLATSEQLENARADVQELCAGSFLEGAPIVLASSRTGTGIEDVKAQLEKLATQVGAVEGCRQPRLWVDRSFSMKGFGTVITGTLSGGSLRGGDDIVIYPLRKSGRIRSMQIHGKQVDSASAGQRTAVNLAGIEVTQIHRGDIVSIAEGVADSFVMDAWVEWLDLAEMPGGRTEFLFHIGSAEMLATVKVLHCPPGGYRTLARLWTPKPVLAFPRDRFILRRPSPTLTVAGGEILDAAPPLRLSRARTVRRLEALAQADDKQRIRIAVEEAGAGRTIEQLQRSTGLQLGSLQQLVRENADLLYYEAQNLVLTKAWLGGRRNRVLNWLKAFHEQNPSLAGAPLGQARLGLSPALASIVLDKLPGLRINGDVVALATHKPLFSDQDLAALSTIEGAFRQSGFQPPPVPDVLVSVARNPQKARSLLEVLLKTKKLVRISDDLVFHADVIAHVRNSLSAHRGRRFSVPEFKEWTQMSRKYAIPVLEYLDRERVTKREGDQRIIL